MNNDRQYLTFICSTLHTKVNQRTYNYENVRRQITRYRSCFDFADQQISAHFLKANRDGSLINVTVK